MLWEEHARPAKAEPPQLDEAKAAELWTLSEKHSKLQEWRDKDEEDRNEREKQEKKRKKQKLKQRLEEELALCMQKKLKTITDSGDEHQEPRKSEQEVDNGVVEGAREWELEVDRLLEQELRNVLARETAETKDKGMGKEKEPESEWEKEKEKGAYDGTERYMDV